MPRPMPGGLRDPTPSTTGRTTETTSSTTRTVQTPKPTQGSWEELCDKYFASKGNTKFFIRVENVLQNLAYQFHALL